MRHFLLFPLLLLLMVTSMASWGQTLTLDQADMDYAPGETVYITGTDFLPGESITMTISHIEPGLPLIFHEHALVYATADSIGTFNASWYVEDVELNTTMSLLAEGDQGSLTSVVFTDALKTDTYPTSIYTLTGKNLYCQDETALELKAEWINTTCESSSNGNNTYVPITIKWFSPLSGTPLQTIITDSKTTSSTYIPPTNTPGTFYYFVVVSWDAGKNCAPEGHLVSGRRGVTVFDLPDTPTITANGPTSFCTGGNVTLTSSAGYGYLWSTGATTQSITITSAGNYTVQVKNERGCLSASSPSLKVTVNPLPSTPTISAGGPTTFCTGGSVTLTSSLGTGYLWSTGETTRSITVTASGNYSVRVSNASGCQSNVSAITAVTVNPIPARPTVTANGGTTTVCDGGAVVLSSSASSGNQWYRDGSVLPGAVNPTYSATTGGSYAVVVTANGCPSPMSDAIHVTVNARPTGLLSGTQTICNGNSATLSIAVTGTGPWSGTLTGGIPFSGSSNPITVNVSPAANATYSLTSLIDAQCTAEAGDLSGNATITVRPIPSAAIAITGNSTICSGTTTTIKITGPLNGTVIYNVNGGSDITGTFNNGGNLNLTTASLTANTTYNLVSVAYGDAPNCSNSVEGSVMVTVNQPPVITTQPENQAVTYGGSASFTVASNGIPAPSYQWQVNSGSGFTDIAGANSTILNVEYPTVAMNGSRYRVIVHNTCATVTSQEVGLTVNARPITITAEAKTKIYGNDDPALTYQVTSGTLLSGDAFTGSLTRDAGENTGTYAITRGTVALNSNYALSYAGADLTVTKRAITITADAKTKTYGDNDPVLTAQATNVVNNDQPTGTLSRAAGKDVGSYAISQSTYTYGSNYDETFVGANLVIGQREITITAEAQSKVYGDPDPELTAKASNVVEGDVPSGVLSRAAGEDVGSYLISKNSYTYGPNYSETFEGANLVIGQRAITITADAQSKTYGDPDPELTAKATNVVKDDQPTGALSRAEGENVGSYAISKNSYTYGPNYLETFEGANLVIGQRPITITADAKTKTYGNDDPELTAQVTVGTIVGADEASGSLSRATGEIVGSYAISKSSYTYGSNYAETFVGANLVIGQRPITIKAEAKNKTYGNADPELTAQATNVVVGDQPTGALSRAEGENVGSYLISKSTYTYGSNYSESFEAANLVIGQRPITIKADAQSKTYGDPDPELTAKATNVVVGDQPTGALSRAEGENVGSYLISKSTYTYGSNYSESFEAANLVIGQRPITITADAQSKTYGDPDPELTAKATNVVVGDVPSGALSRAEGENVGSYLISKSTYTYGSNYEEKFVEANLVIGQRPITITAEAKNKTYGDPDPELTAQATNVVDGDNPTGALSRAEGENVGSYVISKSTFTYGSNYSETFEAANLVIGQRSIIIKADAQSKTYGEADPTLTAQATNVVNNDQPTGALSRAEGENVGSYLISKSTYTYGSNYSESFEAANLVIGQRPITIKADAQSKTYGDPDPELTAKATNVVDGDQPTGALSRAEGENVGSYLISKSTYTYGSNYSESFEAANLVIGQRPITIKADAQSKTYGDPDPELTAKATNVVDGDVPSGSLSRATGENVGSYLISKSTYTYGSNYDEKFVEANLVIGQRPITITADAQSKTYGDPDPELTAKASNVIVGDQPTGTLSRAEGENVGSYLISKSTYTYGSNYAETYVEANLVIGQRPITITADAQSKTYGDPDPELTAQATNVVVGDQPTGALSRAEGENVGSYAISKSSYTYGSNYAESFEEANLVIGQRSITIKADTQSKIYGDPDPELTAQATNVVEGDQPTGALSRAEGENAGSYVISKSTFTYGSNYEEKFVEANLVIGQRPITITADAQSKTYGDPDPELTAQATNVVEGDQPTGAILRAEGENVGSYLISKSTYTYGSNYEEKFVGANLVIGQRPITITADAQSKTYGDPDPVLTAKATNTVGTDAPSGTLSRATGENVGTYLISKSTYTYGSNYAETYVEANLVIGQRPITITADTQSKTYGDPDPELTAKATNVVVGDVPSGALSRAEGENVGSYLISKSTFTYGSNYSESFEAANLVIGQRPITITAEAKSKTYGDPDPELTAKATNVVVGDVPSGALSRAEGENVGSYLISKSTFTYGSNYEEKFVEANLVIGQRPITITADPKTKIYGDNDPVFTAKATNTVGTDAPSGTLSRAEGENVGSYLISKSTYTYGSNYEEKFVEANLVIGQRPITITADAQSKTYGDPDPELTAKATNVVVGDVPSGALSRAEGENVGSYLISKSTFTYGSNYAETFVGANLVIDQRSITITADAKSKIYGDLDPVLTAQATNVMNGDAPNGKLSRAAGENVGSYLISKNSYTYGSNYKETFIGGNLVIGKRPITITAEAKSKYIGQIDPDLTFICSPAVGTCLANGEVICFTGKLKRDNGDCMGKYDILKGDVGNNNYEITYNKATFTINGVTVDASSSSKPVAINTPILTLSAKVYDGLKLLPKVSVKFIVEDGNGIKTTYGPVYTGDIENENLGVASIPLSNLTSKTDVLMVTAIVGDGCTTTSSSIAYLAVYDLNGGFVTGGGWILSPPGAYVVNNVSTTLTGKANFGFNSKYEKGKTTPTGNTEFQFQVGNLNFSSSTYYLGSLVIAGAKATYKGVGTINGSGNYAFMVSAIDGDVTGGNGIDRFRIKIWNGNNVIYDNNMGKDENDVPTTSLGGGSIVIHSNVNNNKIAQITTEASPAEFVPTLKVYPNPFTDRLNIEFSYDTDTHGKLEIYSITGAKLQTLYDGPVTGGQLYNFEYLPRLVSSQVVFYHLTLDGKTQVGKVLFNERK